MSANRLEGAPVAEQVLGQVKQRVAALRHRGVVPGLCTILVGDDPASVGYVRKKHQACAAIGVHSVDLRLDANVTQAELSATIRRVNDDHRIHGMLIQHPLPPPLDFGLALLEMSPGKDADGLHPENLGRLASGMACSLPATPAGIRAMLLHYRIPTVGRHVVVVGRGPTLGRPLSLLMSGRGPGGDAAVTVVHSRVDDLGAHTLRGDIVISGVGRPGILRAEMVKPGAVVVNAGIRWQGRRLLPDVDEAVAERASFMTPRLGGVGVTTVAMLLDNTIGLAERAR